MAIFHFFSRFYFYVYFFLTPRCFLSTLNFKHCTTRQERDGSNDSNDDDDKLNDNND